MDSRGRLSPHFIFPIKDRPGIFIPGRLAGIALHLNKSGWLLDVLVEVEGIEQVVDGRSVGWDVGIACGRGGVGQVVAAAASDGFQAPVSLDEFDEGNVV